MRSLRPCVSRQGHELNGALCDISTPCASRRPHDSRSAGAALVCRALWCVARRRRRADAQHSSLPWRLHQSHEHRESEPSPPSSSSHHSSTISNHDAIKLWGKHAIALLPLSPARRSNAPTWPRRGQGSHSGLERAGLLECLSSFGAKCSERSRRLL